jgi:hypothetical protein
LGDEETRVAYLRTEISVHVPDVGWVDAGSALEAVGGPIHVLTASNPGHERPSAEANAQANTRLELDLLETGATIFKAVGESPEGDHVEESFAAIGLGREAAVELGRQYRQTAIFELNGGEQIVVGCGGDWELSRPLTAEPPTR